MQENDNNTTKSDYAQERLRLCLSSIKMGVWDWDIVNDVLTWDQSLYELYGVRQEDFKGAYEAWEQTVHPDDKERSVQELQAALRGENEFDTSFRVITPEGEVKVIAAKGRVERDAAGNPMRIMGVNWDVTKEHKQAATILAQQASLINSAKMASLGEMVGGIAHEINNPLAIIAGRAGRIRRLAERGELSHEQLIADLEQISSTCLRISKVIHGLKTISRNAQKDPFMPVSVNQVIADTLSLCEHRTMAQKVTIETDFQGEFVVLGRAAQLEQVMLNLLNNSFDAIAGIPDPRIWIEACNHDHSVQVSITDSGSGIPKEIAQKIMEPFFTTKPVGKGTGLGLSISRDIMTEHHGLLTLDEFSEHTRFVIEMPLYRQQGSIELS